MARRFVVDVEGVPPSPSPISNAVIVGNHCWISGQLSVGSDGSYVPGTAREEARRAFDHVFGSSKRRASRVRISSMSTSPLSI